MSTRKSATSQQTFTIAARAAAPTLANQAKRLADTAKFLSTAPDFSPATLILLREIIAEMSEVEVTCKQIHTLSLKRGNTYYDEQKSALNRGFDWKTGKRREEAAE